MNFDDMLTTWRAQEDKPLYGVNQDLLRLVLQHEQADLRRKLRLEQWSVFGGSALLLGFAGFFLLAFLFYRSVWGSVAAGVAACAALAGAGAVWLSRRRQAQRERAFGNSLSEEIKRNLSLVDYQLSRHGRVESALLKAAPTTLGAVLICLLSFQMNTQPEGWFRVGGPMRAATIPALVALSVVLAIWSSRKTNQELLPRRRRLSELLEMLNKSE